jgi:hypothetical protein
MILQRLQEMRSYTTVVRGRRRAHEPRWFGVLDVGLLLYSPSPEAIGGQRRARLYRDAIA